MDWLPGAEIVRANIDGYSYVNVPWRLVLHTTEGGSVDGAVGAYRKKPQGWPHLTMSYEERRVVQHLPFSKAAAALANRPGGAETNKARAIQVEMVGHAFQTQDWANAKVDWFGNHLAPILAALDIRRHSPTFYGTDAGWALATPTARQRMSSTQWNAFGGVCGHQHVGEGNDHWDPGKFRIDRFLAATGGATEEDDLKEGEHNALIDVWSDITGGLGGKSLRKVIMEIAIDQKSRDTEILKTLKSIDKKLS